MRKFNWVFDWLNFNVSHLPKVGEDIWIHDSDGATGHEVMDAYIHESGSVKVFVGHYLPKPEYRDGYPYYYTMRIGHAQLAKHDLSKIEKVYYDGSIVSYPRPYDHICFTRSPTLAECKSKIAMMRNNHR